MTRGSVIAASGASASSSPVDAFELQAQQADLLGEGAGALLEAAELVAVLERQQEQHDRRHEEQQVGRQAEAEQVGGPAEQAGHDRDHERRTGR